MSFLTDILTDAYTAGYKKALEATGGLPPYLSLNKAYALYKRKRVEKWIEAKLITPVRISGKRNGQVRLSRERLELLDGLSWLDIKHGNIPPEILLENNEQRIFQP